MPTSLPALPRLQTCDESLPDTDSLLWLTFWPAAGKSCKWSRQRRTGPRARLDDGVDKMVRSSLLWREKEELHASVPGIGKVIAGHFWLKCRNLEGSIISKSQPSRAPKSRPTAQAKNF